jgi:FAD/FMN-containing dehydrogenase
LPSSPLAELEAIIGSEHVLTTADAVAPYCEDWRGRRHGVARAVVRPATVGEVAGIVDWSRRHRVPLVPQGGNTGLVYGGIPDKSGQAVVVQLGRLNRVRELDATNAVTIVEAGVVLQTLQQRAAEAGLFFPVSLAAEGSCQIGGTIATNAGGTAVLRYGNMRDQVLGLEVVLPDGQVWNGLRSLRKDNTGYDIKHLFIGSEGTLGIITAAALKLHAAPRSRATALASVRDFAAAVRLFQLAREHAADVLSGCECFTEACRALVETHAPHVAQPALRGGVYILLQLDAASTEIPLDAILESILGAGFEQDIVEDGVIAQSLAQAEQLWGLRENITEAQKRAGPSFSHDVSTPISAIPDFVERSLAALQALDPGLRPVVFGHIGDGNLHFNILAPAGLAPNRRETLQKQVETALYDLVDACKGSISAEHGLGEMKRDLIELYRPAVTSELMRTVKLQFDPANLMNSGKAVRLR